MPIVLGSSSREWNPAARPPRVDTYNSAYLIEPGASKPAARYDKQHLVVFGEYVPFRERFRWLHRWLNSITPWGKDGREYSLTPGAANNVFTLAAASRDGRRYRAAVPICYEEIMPYIARDFTRPDEDGRDGKNIDLLLSISNDGWFLHSCEQEQHLAAAVFRAVENRISVARSVNTGTSAMVLPNGKIHSRVALSAEQIAGLDPVRRALNRLRDRLDAVAAAGRNGEAVATARSKMGETLARDLRPALVALGDEFQYIADRLARLQGNLTPRNPRLDEAVEMVRLRLDRDIETVARWRAQPSTAPSVGIDTARTDARLTLYTRLGDWFCWLAVGLSALMVLDWCGCRSGRRSPPAQTTEGPHG
ncbi:MAG: apolipoprotein N-acyltransferase [Phycisphaerae bacterium]